MNIPVFLEALRHPTDGIIRTVEYNAGNVSFKKLHISCHCFDFGIKREVVLLFIPASTYQLKFLAN